MFFLSYPRNFQHTISEFDPLVWDSRLGCKCTDLEKVSSEFTDVQRELQGLVYKKQIKKDIKTF